MVEVAMMVAVAEPSSRCLTSQLLTGRRRKRMMRRRKRRRRKARKRKARRCESGTSCESVSEHRFTRPTWDNIE